MSADKIASFLLISAGCAVVMFGFAVAVDPVGAVHVLDLYTSQQIPR